MKKPTTSMPHNAVSKKFPSHPKTTWDFLDSYLPVPLREFCGLNALKLEPGSFVEEDLRASYSDVLWLLRTRTGKGYIRALIEHQSSPDTHMAFRMMCYAIAVMQSHLDAGRKTLPLVVPILLYHGVASPHLFSLCWSGEFDSPKTVWQLCEAVFPLVDITVVPDDEVTQYRRMALLELVQRHIREHDLMVPVDKLAVLLIKGHANDSQVEMLFNYLVQPGSAPRFEAFIREVALRIPQHEERLVTITECLRESGQRTGLLGGKLKGKREGRRDEVLRIARAILEKGIDRELVLIITGLAIDELIVSSD